MSATMLSYLVALLVTVALLLSTITPARTQARKAKQQDAMMHSGNAQSLSATVVSIMYDHGLPDYLMVEWTDPETQRRVTGQTNKIYGSCPYKVGDTVSILIHPNILEVWLAEQPTT